MGPLSDLETVVRESKIGIGDEIVQSRTGQENRLSEERTRGRKESRFRVTWFRVWGIW